MQTQRMFLTAIAADPDDDLLRLAFADWLEEQGKHCWAGVLRTQVRRRRPNPLHTSVFPVFGTSVFGGWFGSDPPDMKQLTAEMGYPVAFEPNGLIRGLPGCLDLTAEQFLDLGDALAAWGPMPAIRLLSVLRYLDALVRCDALAAVWSLDLTSTGLTDDALAVLLRSDRLGRLTMLNLGDDWYNRNNRLTARAGELLAHTTALPALEHLCLRRTGVGDEGTAALAAGPALRKLKTLNLERCGLSGAGLLPLADAAPWPELRDWKLAGNPLSPQGAAALADSPQTATLWNLDLSNTRFPDEAVRLLGQSPHPTHLRTLNLDGNPVSDDGFIALGESPALAGLGWLKVGRKGPRPGEQPSPRIGPRGGSVLGQARFAGSLRFLELSGQAVGDAGLSALACSGRYLQLERLDLSGNEIGDDGALALAGSDPFPSLKRLLLSGNHIQSTGARALAGWPGLLRLDSFASSFKNNPLGPWAVDLIYRSRFSERQFQGDERIELDLSGVNLGDEGVLRLTEHSGMAWCSNLELLDNGITAVGARLLAQCPAVKNLQRLELGNNPLGDLGAIALAGSPYLAGLTELGLGTCGLTDAGVIALSQSKNLSGLCTLALFGSGLTDVAAIRVLQAWPNLTTLYLNRAGLSDAVQAALREQFGEQVKFV